MDGTAVLWIVLAVVVLLVLLFAVVAGMRRAKERKLEDDRQHAYNLHQEAQEAELRAQKQEAVAAEVDARSRKAQAEADEKRAEAQRLAAGAREREGVASEARAESAQHRDRASQLDPDVADDGWTREDGRMPLVGRKDEAHHLSDDNRTDDKRMSDDRMSDGETRTGAREARRDGSRAHSEDQTKGKGDSPGHSAH